MSPVLDIYTYSDFRSLLADFYAHKKKKGVRQFSYRHFSKKAGFSSPNFLHRVIRGNRNLGLSGLQKVVRAMQLSSKESQFFEALVHFNQVDEPQQKVHAFEKLLSLREFREARPLTREQYDFYSKWYYAVIREMINTKWFVEDPIWIVKKLNSLITTTEASQALKDLERLQLIRRHQNGKLELTDSHITSDPNVHSVALKKFHVQMIEQGALSLQQPADEREVSSLTMSLTKKQFEKIRGKVRELQKEIQKIIAQEKEAEPESVYQLNLQLFDILSPKRRRI